MQTQRICVDLHFQKMSPKPTKKKVFMQIQRMCVDLHFQKMPR